jgi:cellulose synthase operon protein C
MEFPKLKLCWNGSRVAAKWRFGFFGTYTSGSGLALVHVVIISLRGVLAWLGVLAVAAYFIGAAALWFWLDRRPHNFVTYADLILPVRWGEIDGKRGRAMIAEGLDDIEAQRWGEGMQKLRIGIARHPDEIKGRLVLAEIFLAIKARKLAVETYDGGLAARYPGRAYIEAMIRVASQAEDFDWWLRTCERALVLVGDAPEQADERSWLVSQKLSALLAADRAGEALQLAESAGELHSPMIGEFRVMALLKAGRPADAVRLLDEWSARAEGRAGAQVLRLQVRAYREAVDFAGMDRALEALRALSPTDARAHVYGIVQNTLAGRATEAADGMEQFFLRFGSRAQDVQMLAAPLAEIAALDPLRRVVAHAERQGFDMQAFRRYLCDVHIAQGEWREAAEVLAAMDAEIDEAKNPQLAQWHALMTAQVQAALDAGEGTQSTLVSLVRGRPFTLGVYKDLITAMRRAGRAATAREIVTFAQGLYPQNKDIETWRVELDAELAAARAAVAPVVITGRTATGADAGKAADATAAPVREELSEAVFFTRLEELVKADKPSEALLFIREARRARPAWLSGRDAELQRAEIRLSGRAGDVLGMRSAARLYLTGERIRLAQMIEVARDLHSTGRKDEAVVLLREILAKEPAYVVAQKLMDEWVPKDPATPPKS